MKIVEQYIHETGRRMPAKGRTETMEELRSLLLDEMEKRFGPEPTAEQAKEVLAGFGPPADVAKRYGGDVQVIAPALADLYFLILKIILGAMAVAFTTVFVVEAATGAIGEAEFWGALVQVPFRIAGGFFSGAGVVSLIFIAITRTAWSSGARLDDDWTPDELEGVVIEPQTESTWSRVLSIVFGVGAIVLLNVYPEVVTLAEDAFLRSTLTLGHRLSIEVFRSYVVVLSVIMALEVAHHAVSLRLGDRDPRLRLARTGITLATIVLTAIMLADMRLYTDYTSLNGFRLIVLIALVGHIIGLIGEVVEYAKVKALAVRVG